MTDGRDVSVSDLSAFPLPSLDAASDKDGRGAVLVVAGGPQVPGAGKLKLAATAPTALALGLAIPEAAVLPVPETEGGEISATASRKLADSACRADAVVIGPGMMSEKDATELGLALIRAAPGVPFVLDAAALTGLDLAWTHTHALKGRLVITPHAGEMARLTGRSKQAILADPVGATRDVSLALKAVVVMKGETSFIVSPEGQVWRHGDGSIGLGTSGSGDVLAGVVAGLLARGAAPETAAIWGVCVHARAGALLAEKVGAVGFLARELLPEIPGVLHDAA